MRGHSEKERLFAQKDAVWERLGYQRDYLQRLRGRTFWEEESGHVEDIDRRWMEQRGTLS